MHGALLALLRLPVPGYVAVAPQETLTVELKPAATAMAARAQPPMRKAIEPTRHPARAAAVGHLATHLPANSAGEQPEAEPAAAPGPAASLPSRALDREAILATARATAREAEPRNPSPPHPSQLFDDRPALPGLAHALNNALPGERDMGYGLIRIVTANGRVFCMQRPTDSSYDGPVAPAAMTVTCP